MYYLWKNEPFHEWLYHTITDSLDTEHAIRDHYCLDLSCDTQHPWIKRAYKKIYWPPILAYRKIDPVPVSWRVGFFASCENLVLGEGGYVRMRVEVHSTAGGASSRSVAGPPAKRVIIDMPEGTHDITEYAAELEIPPEETGNVCVMVEGVNYSGKVFVERPFLAAASHNMLPPFSVVSAPNIEQYEWTGQHLSKKEWPRFEVSLNGERIFAGEVFERCHRTSEWEIDIPSKRVRDKNLLEIRNISDYHEPLPYTINEVGIVSTPEAPVVIVARSACGNTANGACVLLRTSMDNTGVRFESPDGNLIGEPEYHFAEAGLHGVHLGASKACENAVARFSRVSCVTRENIVVECVIPRMVEKQDDGIITGTGDLIYIRDNIESVEEYLAWYVSNNVGNMLTIRPSYRWSGIRNVNPPVWKMLCRVLNELGIKYVNIVDGRELPGTAINPEPQLLAGPGYLGRQAHEVDGILFYWGSEIRPKEPFAEQINDMKQFAFDDDPEHASSIRFPSKRFHCVSDNVHWCKRPLMTRDLREAAIQSVEDIRDICEGIDRQTGPSFMIKYFAQAGLKLLGAETMYGNMEVIMAFLRGACRYAGYNKCGVHHAVQWSSAPHDTPERMRRYRLALFSSYMLGATDINTEEGLWHLEEYCSRFHRFSDACRGHAKQQREFFEYVSENSRTGEFYTPTGIIHGRYDGTNGFTGDFRPFRMGHAAIPEIMKSWQLLDVFYPHYHFSEALYRQLCPPNKPQGYYSGTPLGQVDAIPMESSIDVLKRYQSLAFLAYNCAEPDDIEKLHTFVADGGSLLLCLPHISCTTSVDDLQANRFVYPEGLWIFNGKTPLFADKPVGGYTLQTAMNLRAPAKVLATADDGTPLACVYNYGKGRLTVLNANAYPANPAIKPLYEKLLRETASETVAKELVWASVGNDVEFALYKQPDGATHVYFLAVDWYNSSSKPRIAVLRVGDHAKTVIVPYGELVKFSVCHH